MDGQMCMVENEIKIKNNRRKKEEKEWKGIMYINMP